MTFVREWEFDPRGLAPAVSLTIRVEGQPAHVAFFEWMDVEVRLGEHAETAS